MTVALAIPHCPWIPSRVESMARLTASLGLNAHGAAVTMMSTDVLIEARIFADRESNRVWSQKIFRWALDTDATHLLQLQDDALVAPRFWPILRAMIEAQPDRIIGLEVTHPLAPVQHRAGRRWYRDHWLIGVGYVFPTSLLGHYVDWCDAHPERVAKTNEDSLISEWSYESKGTADIFHPIPTIIDHDLGVPSTYGNDGHHEFSMYRKTLVTWRDVDTPALEDPDYWRVTEEGAPLLPGPGTSLCWYCGIEQGKLTSAKTGARLGPQCLADMLGHLLGRM
jgi:hypothetical protein